MKRVLFIVLGLVLMATAAWYIYSTPSTQQLIDDRRPTKKESTPAVEVIQGLKSCDICGYLALEKKGAVCGDCGYSINQEMVDAENVSSIEEYIIVKQIEYFMPDTLGSSIDFLSPAISAKGYPKNTNWRPRVYETQIYEIQKAMMEADARKAVQQDSTTTTGE